MSEPQIPDYETIAAKFRPIFTRIAAGATEREINRQLANEPVRWLKEAGFGALRIPVEQGFWCQLTAIIPVADRAGGS